MHAELHSASKCSGLCVMLHGRLVCGLQCQQLLFSLIPVLFGTDWDLLRLSGNNFSDTLVAFVNIACICVYLLEEEANGATVTGSRNPQGALVEFSDWICCNIFEECWLWFMNNFFFPFWVVWSLSHNPHLLLGREWAGYLLLHILKVSQVLHGVNSFSQGWLWRWRKMMMWSPFSGLFGFWFIQGWMCGDAS